MKYSLFHFFFSFIVICWIKIGFLTNGIRIVDPTGEIDQVLEEIYRQQKNEELLNSMLEKWQEKKKKKKKTIEEEKRVTKVEEK